MKSLIAATASDIREALPASNCERPTKPPELILGPVHMRSIAELSLPSIAAEIHLWCAEFDDFVPLSPLDEFSAFYFERNDNMSGRFRGEPE